MSAALVLCLLVLVPLVADPLDAQAYYLAFILFLLTLLPLVVGLARGTLDVFEPIIPISLLIGLAFGIRAMYLVYDRDTFLAVQVARVSFDDFMSNALILATAGYGALLFGYYVISGPAWRALRGPRGDVTWTWPPKLSRAKIIALTAIAMVATAGRITSGELTGASQNLFEVTSATFTLGLLASFAQCSACILALYIAAGDNRRWLRLALWLGVVPLAALQALAFSGKAPLLLALYAVMAASHYAKRRLQLHFLAAGVVVSVLVVFPTVNAFREPAEQALSVSFMGPTVQEFASRVVAIPSLFAGMTVSEYARFALESVVGRANGIDSLALVMKYDATANLGNPTAYWQIPLLAFVPRVIWPDKPVILSGAEFARLFVTPADQGLTSYPSIGMFHVGDLYASFGAAGVLIGMCLLGCLYRLVYRFFDPAHSPDLGMKFLYILLLWSIVNGFESDIPTIYGNLLKSLLIWFLIKMWFNARARDAAWQHRVPIRIRRSLVARQQPRAASHALAVPR